MNELAPSTPEDGPHLISPTAKLVAHLRSKTDIPFSKELDVACGAEQATKEFFGDKEGFEWMSAMLELRFKSLSKLLNSELHMHDIKQVLELASGVQPRGMIVSENPKITYIETDLPDMASEKRRILEQRFPEILARKNFEVVPLDLFNLEEFKRISDTFKPGPLAIINEGLLPYLIKEEKEIAAVHIHAALVDHGGVWITPDLSNSGKMGEIIKAFPKAEEAIQSINAVVKRDLRANSLGDKEASLAFYKGIGFNITEYRQMNLIQDLTSLDALPNELREVVRSALKESRIWVLEAVE